MGDLNRAVPDVSQKTLRASEILFDFEGTLVDFQWRLVPAVEECLEELARAGFKSEWYGDNPSYAHVYNETLNLARRGYGNEDAASAAIVVDGVYDKYDADALTRWQLYPDTVDVLETLRGSGYRMGIVSNVGRVSLEEAMDKFGLWKQVEVVVSRNDVQRLKPHPEGLLKAAGALEVDPSRVVFVGDSRNDVGAAREAGMLAAYIRGGEDAPSAMARFPADLELRSLTELPMAATRIGQ